MGFNLANVQGREPVALAVAIEAAGGATVNLEYDPGRYNATIEERTGNDLTKTPAGVVRDFLCTFVTSWDVVDGEEPVPIEPGAIAKLVPFADVQYPIFLAIMGDINAGKVLRRSKNDSAGPLPLEKPRPRPSRRAASPARP